VVDAESDVGMERAQLAISQATPGA
jgi:hypothetical protein